MSVRPRTAVIALIGLALSVAPSTPAALGAQAAFAETGTWSTGDYPVLDLGVSKGFKPSVTCFDTFFTYRSHLGSNGFYDPIGHDETLPTCAQPTQIGDLGATGSRLIRPYGSKYAYDVYDATGRTAGVIGSPDGQVLTLAPPTPFFGPSTYLSFYPGHVMTEVGNSGMSIKLKPLSLLRDSGGNLIRKMPPTAYALNGDWMVIYAIGLGLLRINTRTEAVLLFDTTPYNYDGGFEPSITLAISDDGKTVIRSGVGDAAVGSTAVFDLSGCTEGTPFVLNANNSVAGCRSRSVLNDLRVKHPGFVGMTSMEFTPDGKSVRAQVDVVNATGQHEYFNQATYSVAGYTPPDPTGYLALGDSFSSGEGTYVYETGTDAGAGKNLCHSAPDRNYPFLVDGQARVHGTLNPDEKFHSVACSGAISADYFSRARYPVSPPPPGSPTPEFPWLPGSEPQRAYVRQAQPGAVTISMIGNDIGFSDKLTRCVALADSCFHFKEDREAIAREIYSKFDTLVAMYEDIQMRAPGVKVYVVGYPQILSTEGVCGYNVFFDPEERAMARGMIGYLNAVIKAATARAGVRFVDVKSAFDGEELCGRGTPAVNGLVRGEEIGGFLGLPNFLGAESFHPNMRGHELLAREVQEQSANLTTPMPVLKDASGKLVTTDRSVIAPYVGSPEWTAFIGNSPSGGVATRSLYVGEEHLRLVVRNRPTLGAPLISNQLEKFLARNSQVGAFVHSTPTQVGTLNVNSEGNLVGDITVPATVLPGIHSLHLYGKDHDGNAVDLNQTIYVAASDQDIDGDGVANDDEACLLVPPANVDEDFDEIDDACDGEISRDFDTTPPLVTAQPARLPDHGDWYTRPVTVTWDSADPAPSSGDPTIPGPVEIDSDGVHQLTSTASCDPAGNCASASTTIRLDQTAPTATWAADRAPNDAEWYDGPVTLVATCSDEVSGVAACPGPMTILDDGAGQTHRGRAFDLAGNEQAFTSDPISIDQTDPEIHGSAEREPDHGLWYNKPLTITFDCHDDVSGVAACPGAALIQSDGEIPMTGATIDAAGNGASTEFLVLLDSKPPTSTATSECSGWCRAGDLDFVLEATDETSGVDHIAWSLTGPSGISDSGTIDGSSGTVTMTTPSGSTGPVALTYAAVDSAGNVEDAQTLTVDTDGASPSIHATVDPAPNASGWHSTDVTVSFNCDDSDSGIVSCPDDVTLTEETSGITVLGDAVDAAGNTASASVGVRLDKTAPSITAAVAPGPGVSLVRGWWNGPVTVEFTCSDELSGIVACPEDVLVASNGANQTITGTGTDAAGNSRSRQLTLSIDGVAPTIVTSTSPSPNAAGWHKTAATVSFFCADTHSGVHLCTSPITVSTDTGKAGTSVTGQVEDVAGHNASASVGVKLDRTKPTVTVSKRSGNAISGTATDSGSGVQAVAVTMSTPAGLLGLWPAISQTTIATLTCANPDSCTWNTTLPGNGLANLLGTWTITATASDIADNTAVTTRTGW